MPDFPPASEYVEGSLKRHPDWPSTKCLVMRTVFNDDTTGACKAWLDITPGSGTNYRLHLEVQDWPDVELTDLVTEDP